MKNRYHEHDQRVDLLIKAGVVPEKFRKLVIIGQATNPHLAFEEVFTGAECVKKSYQYRSYWIVMI